MTTLDELLTQRRDILRKKSHLKRYQYERHMVQEELEKQLMEKDEELKRYSKLTPGSVPARITDYDNELVRIHSQIDEIERLDESRQQLEGLGNPLTEAGIQLLTRQAGQQESSRYSRPPSQVGELAAG